MKLLKVLIILLVGLVSNAYAISLTDSLTPSRLIGPNEHAHITTSPVKIYAITVTPTAANGFAQIIETNSPRQDTEAIGSSLIGRAFVSEGGASKVKADINGATANSSINMVYPYGLPVSENMFVDCQDAYIQIYYVE